jgi:CRP-like cAMP-binding protein
MNAGGPPASSFLGSLDAASRDALLSAGRRSRRQHGTPLFLEGAGGGGVLFLLDGHAKVFVTTGEGRDILLAIRGPGDIVGELSAVDGLPRSASATTIDECEVLTVPLGVFQAHLVRSQDVAASLLRILAERLRDADRIRAQFGSEDTVTRLAEGLVELADRFGRIEDDLFVVDLPLTQQEIAGWIGASREAVTKALHGLRARGLVETGRRRVVICDMEGLRARAGSPPPLRDTGR